MKPALSVLLILPTLASILAVGTGCAGKGVKTETATVKASATAPAHRSLTHEEAIIRHRMVSRPTYNLWFGLSAHGDEFEGRTVISFDLRQKARDYGKQLFIDFADGQIRSLKINGTMVPAEDIARFYDGGRITFRLAELLPGSNRVEIAYTHAFSKDGQGFNRFKDPEDNQVYLHTQLEPFAANRVFPCFDQPDLKGSYEVTVEAPEDWQVIANMPERTISKVDGRRSWAFPPSPLISTYVFGLNAGPFQEFKDSAEGIPLRLFVRESLAAKLPGKEWTKDWFETTKKGIDFFGVQFGYPFPYPKLDQVLLPEFGGGMENVGAITYTENLAYRGQVTAQMRRGLRSMILHEIAHMWFGDLVTMRWWNSLWLNESFATYASSLALSEAMGDKAAWQEFFASAKQHAFWEDQLVTTHPIESAVPDTATADTVFDGISYGKGASVIKQLAAYVGEDDFREGLQRYFQKHALRNATLTDFTAALSEASGKNLAAWQKSWLQTSGLNTVRAEWACEDGKISSFVLLQGNSETSQELRTHRAEVALYRSAGKGGLAVTDTAAVTYSGKETEVKELLGKKCPDFVYPNHRDLDYVKVELDAQSLKTAQQGLSSLADPFARTLVWSTLANMMIEGKLPAPQFAELVFRFAPKEREPEQLGRLLGLLGKRLPGYPSVLLYLPPEARSEYLSRLEKFLLKNLLAAPAGSDLQLTWYSHFVSAATGSDSVEFLMKLLKPSRKAGFSAALAGFRLDNQRRWEILIELARAGAIGQDRIDEELKADPTESGRMAAISASASLPDAEAKRIWINRILASVSAPQMPATTATTTSAGPEIKYSWAKLRSAMWRLNIVGQEPLTRQMMSTYFETIPRLADPALAEYAGSFARGLFPYLCDPEVVKHATAALDRGSNLPPSVIKSLKIGRQLEERCIRARALASASGA